MSISGIEAAVARVYAASASVESASLHLLLLEMGKAEAAHVMYEIHRSAMTAIEKFYGQDPIFKELQLKQEIERLSKQ